MFQKLSALSFFLLLLGVALVAVFFPVGNGIDLSKTIAALSTHDGVVMLGNSAIDHSSKCDADSRSLAALTGAAIGKPVADFSNSAQLLDETLSYAGILLRNRNVHTIVLPLAYFSFTDDWHPSFQRAAFLNFMSATPGRFSATGDLLASGIVGTDLTVHRSFTYAGRDYPDYDGIKVRYFQPAKDVMGCPETDGVDRRFLEAYYSHVYADTPVLEKNIWAVSEFAHAAARQGRAVKVVLLPVDLELIASLSPGAATRTRRGIEKLVAALRSQGVDVLDLSPSLPNIAFADRWCACGHMQQDGRIRVAGAIAQFMADGG